MLSTTLKVTYKETELIKEALEELNGEQLLIVNDVNNYDAKQRHDARAKSVQLTDLLNKLFS
jgi:hypothetical protein